MDIKQVKAFPSLLTGRTSMSKHRRLKLAQLVAAHIFLVVGTSTVGASEAVRFDIGAYYAVEQPGSPLVDTDGNFFLDLSFEAYEHYFGNNLVEELRWERSRNGIYFEEVPAFAQSLEPGTYYYRIVGLKGDEYCDQDRCHSGIPYPRYYSRAVRVDVVY